MARMIILIIFMKVSFDQKNAFLTTIPQLIMVIELSEANIVIIIVQT